MVQLIMESSAGDSVLLMKQNCWCNNFAQTMTEFQFVPYVMMQNFLIRYGEWGMNSGIIEK